MSRGVVDSVLHEARAYSPTPEIRVDRDHVKDEHAIDLVRCEEVNILNRKKHFRRLVSLICLVAKILHLPLILRSMPKQWRLGKNA